MRVSLELRLSIGGRRGATWPTAHRGLSAPACAPSATFSPIPACSSPSAGEGGGLPSLGIPVIRPFAFLNGKCPRRWVKWGAVDVGNRPKCGACLRPRPAPFPAHAACVRIVPSRSQCRRPPPCGAAHCRRRCPRFPLPRLQDPPSQGRQRGIPMLSFSCVSLSACAFDPARAPFVPARPRFPWIPPVFGRFCRPHVPCRSRMPHAWAHCMELSFCVPSALPACAPRPQAGRKAGEGA